MTQEQEAASLKMWEEIYKQHKCGDEDDGHRCVTTPELIKYVKTLLPAEPADVFLPLCGQTNDLRWLYDRGNRVVGVEGVEAGVQKFTERNADLKFTRHELEGGIPVYKSKDGRLTVYVCGILNDAVKRLGPFDAVWDYAAYGAIDPEIRPAYVKSVLATVKPDHRYIFEFAHDVEDCGAHFKAITFSQAKNEFGTDEKFTFLETNDESVKWEAKSLFTTYVLATRKTDEEKKAAEAAAAAGAAAVHGHHHHGHHHGNH